MYKIKLIYVYIHNLIYMYIYMHVLPKSIQRKYLLFW